MQNIKLRMHVFLYASIASLIKLTIEIIKTKKNSDYQIGTVGISILLIIGIVCFIVFLDAKKKLHKQKN